MSPIESYQNYLEHEDTEASRTGIALAVTTPEHPSLCLGSGKANAPPPSLQPPTALIAGLCCLFPPGCGGVSPHSPAVPLSEHLPSCFHGNHLNPATPAGGLMGSSSVALSSSPEQVCAECSRNIHGRKLYFPPQHRNAYPLC